MQAAVHAGPGSGRPAQSCRHAGVTRLPEIWGAHGWERRARWRMVLQEPAAAAGGAGTRARGRANTLPEGGRTKTSTEHRVLARHRQRPLRAIREDDAAWSPLHAQEPSKYCLSTGAWSSVPRCNNICGETRCCPRRRRRAVAYLGDDITDEDAFRAVRLGESAYSCGPSCETAADLWIPAEELLASCALGA